MKLVPDFDLDRIEALKAGLPDPDELTEYCSEKPLPRPPDPLAALPSDSVMTWKVGKLTEKFNRLMGRRAMRQ